MHRSTRVVLEVVLASSMHTFYAYELVVCILLVLASMYTVCIICIKSEARYRSDGLTSTSQPAQTPKGARSIMDRSIEKIEILGGGWMVGVLYLCALHLSADSRIHN